jgi:hypothetical protein
MMFEIKRDLDTELKCYDLGEEALEKSMLVRGQGVPSGIDTHHN